MVHNGLARKGSVSRVFSGLQIIFVSITNGCVISKVIDNNFFWDQILIGWGHTGVSAQF